MKTRAHVFWTLGVALLAQEFCSAGAPTVQGKTREEWRKLLSDPNPFTRVRASYALGNFPLNHPVIADEPSPAPDLIRALKDDEEVVRRNAAWALSRYPVKDAIEPLVAALADSTADVRINAADTLGGMPASVEKAGPSLVKLLEDKDARVRRAAANALGRYGEDAAPAIPALKLVLANDPSDEARYSAIWALSQMGQAVEDDTQVFVDAIKDKDATVRGYAIRMVSHLKVDAKIAGPAFVKALADDSEAVRDIAGDCLVPLGAAVVPLLSEPLKDKDESVRQRTLLVVGMIGPDAAAALPAVRVCLNDKSAGVRARAVAALGGIGPQAKDAVPEITKRLDDPDMSVRRRAVEALKLIETDASKIE